MSRRPMDRPAGRGPVECAVCQARTDSGVICRRCTSEIERALAELPADLADLEAVAAGTAAGPIGLGDAARQWDGPRQDGALGDAPWVFAPGAADQLWAVGNTLSTWIRHLCESRGCAVPRLVTVDTIAARGALTRGAVFSATGSAADAARWLLDHLDAIRLDEAAAQIHEELTALPGENRRCIMLPAPEEEFHGLCDAADVRVEFGVRLWIEANRMHLERGVIRPHVGRCGTQLWSREGAKQIDCRVCGASYTRAERQASMLEELSDTLGTVRQVASTLTTLGRPVTVKQVRNMLARGLIAERGRDPILVRVGDVIEQRAAMVERAGRRSVRRERMSA